MVPDLQPEQVDWEDYGFEYGYPVEYDTEVIEEPDQIEVVRTAEYEDYEDDDS